MKITLRFLFPVLLTVIFILLPTLLFAQMEWICATDSAEWSPRGYHTSIVLNGRLYLIGGYNGSNGKNDVWFTEDGTSWICATDSARWLERCAHSSVSFDDKLWVIGGNVGGNLRNDVWHSTNGINWTEATNSA